MNRTTLIAAVFALLVVTTGVAAAVPGTAPVDADENGTDERPGNGVADDAGDRNGLGPDVSLPEQVPEHVSAIHDQIESFLNGDLAGSLGDAISDLTPGGDETGDADGSEAGEESDATDDSDD